MKSGTRKKKNESKRNRGGLDMAQKALAEYEEIQRRRYHERIRAEKGAPMQITQEDRERVKAMAVIDETNAQYLELFRTGRCPSCEQIATWESVEKHPHHEALNALSGQEASEYLKWTSTHLSDCEFVPAYNELPNLAAKYHIVIALKQFDIPRPDGKLTRDLVPVRVPAAGDPPVPGE